MKPGIERYAFSDHEYSKCGRSAKTIEMGIKKVRVMLLVNDVTRTKCPASELKVALQCGGSDAWSGVTANPPWARLARPFGCAGRHWCSCGNARNLWGRTSVDQTCQNRSTGERLVEMISGGKIIHLVITVQWTIIPALVINRGTKHHS